MYDWRPQSFLLVHSEVEIIKVRHVHVNFRATRLTMEPNSTAGFHHIPCVHGLQLTSLLCYRLLPTLQPTLKWCFSSCWKQHSPAATTRQFCFFANSLRVAWEYLQLWRVVHLMADSHPQAPGQHRLSSCCRPEGCLSTCFQRPPVISNIDYYA